MGYESSLGPGSFQWVQAHNCLIAAIVFQFFFFPIGFILLIVAICLMTYSSETQPLAWSTVFFESCTVSVSSSVGYVQLVIVICVDAFIIVLLTVVRITVPSAPCKPCPILGWGGNISDQRAKQDFVEIGSDDLASDDESDTDPLFNKRRTR